MDEDIRYELEQIRTIVWEDGFWTGISYVRYALYALAGILLILQPFSDSQSVALLILLSGLALAFIEFGVTELRDSVFREHVFRR